MHLMVLHGPNLNLLGVREPNIYGDLTLDEVNHALQVTCQAESVGVEFFQSNSEGALVSKIQEVLDPNRSTKVDGILINPAAYTHSSIAIRDAFLAVGLPFVEVHLSNINSRETFRQKSTLSDIAIGSICGFGFNSYLLGLQGLISYIQEN